jgi:hypothetical protein
MAKSFANTSDVSPPACSFPELAELGQRQLLCGTIEVDAVLSCKTPKRDKSPWVVEPRHGGKAFIPSR